MKIKFTILFTVALLFAAAATQAQGPFTRDRRDGRFFAAQRDRRDLRLDRRDLYHDRRDLYRDRRHW